MGGVSGFFCIVAFEKKRGPGLIFFCQGGFFCGKGTFLTFSGLCLQCNEVDIRKQMSSPLNDISHRKRDCLDVVISVQGDWPVRIRIGPNFGGRKAPNRTYKTIHRACFGPYVLLYISATETFYLMLETLCPGILSLINPPSCRMGCVSAG